MAKKANMQNMMVLPSNPIWNYIFISCFPYVCKVLKFLIFVLRFYRAHRAEMEDMVGIEGLFHELTLEAEEAKANKEKYKELGSSLTNHQGSSTYSANGFTTVNGIKIHTNGGSSATNGSTNGTANGTANGSDDHQST